MAKNSEKTAGRKAMDTAKKLLSDAKTDAQTKAANDAINKAKAMLRAESAVKFKALASKRVSKALAAIGGVGKLANARAYAFDAEQVAKISKALEDEVATLTRRFTSALSKGGTETSGGFSL